MPRIPQYSAPEAPSGPQLAGALSAGEAASGVLSGLASGLDKAGAIVTAHQERQDNTDLSVLHSAAVAQNAIKWAGMERDGTASDPEKVAQFNSDAQDAFSALPENMRTANGRAAATALAGRSAAELTASTTISMAKAQGDQEIIGLKQTAINLSTAIAASSDPVAALDTNLNAWNEGIDAKTHIDPKSRAELKQSGASEFVRGTVDALISQGKIDRAKSLLGSPNANAVLNETQQYQLGLKIDRAEHAQEVAKNADRIEQDRQARAASEAAHKAYIAQLNDPHLNVGKWAHDVQADPDLTAEAQQSLIGFLHARAAEARTEANQTRADADRNSVGFANIYHAIMAPPGPERVNDLTDLQNRATAAGLSVGQTNKLVGYYDKQKSSIASADGMSSAKTEAVNSARRLIVEPDGYKSPEGEVTWSHFIFPAMDAAEKQIAQGLSPTAVFGEGSDWEKSIQAARKAADIASATAPVGKAPAPSSGPAIGAIVKGYKFLGGNPANAASWAKQ